MGSKKSLSSLISRRDPDEDEYDAATREMHEGSDRVAGILGCALVENALLAALASNLANVFDDSALFVDQNAPFSTFKQRIIAGQALGLYTSAAAKDMDIIRDIRNQFAHALLSINFLNTHIAKACDGLRLHEPRPEQTLEGREISPTRWRFESACWGLSYNLLRVAVRGQRNQVERSKLAGVALGHLKTSGFEGRPDDLLSNGVTT